MMMVVIMMMVMMMMMMMVVLWCLYVEQANDMPAHIKCCLYC